MKILVLNGSPKKNSDTFHLTESFLKGLNESKEHDVEIIDVIDKHIAPCRGCFSCWRKDDGHCIIDDDQNAILDLYRNSDVVIWSFPLYCYAMPSHLKAVLDRTLPFARMTMKEVDGKVVHETLFDLSKIHTIVICGCGFPNFEGNFTGLKAMCQACFGNPTTIFVPETPLLGVEAAKPITDPLLNKFVLAGEEFHQNKFLSKETIEQLETPMIPKEVYINIANNQ